jgi:hypothetical protein
MKKKVSIKVMTFFRCESFDSKCKIKVVNLSELQANMERMKQPPLEKDFEY